MTESNFDNQLSTDQDDELLSRTQIKKQMQALQALGGKLTEFNPEQLDKLPLSDRLRSAIDEARLIKPRTAAQKRHLQFIGKILRTEGNSEALEQAMGLYEAGQQAHTQVFHRLERWRDRLIQEGNSALQAYIEEYPAADIQHLRQLIRNAQKELKMEKPPASARKLFKYLREIEDV